MKACENNKKATKLRAQKYQDDEEFRHDPYFCENEMGSFCLSEIHLYSTYTQAK